MKNLVIVLATIAVILLSQNPAEAGPVARSCVRVVKWGACFPFRWICFAPMVLPTFGYACGAGGEILCDAIIYNDQASQDAKQAQAEADAQAAAEAKDAESADEAPAKTDSEGGE